MWKLIKKAVRYWILFLHTTSIVSLSVELTYTQIPQTYMGCLSLLSLNGQTDTFWQIVRDNPEALPSQIANKLHVATGRNITGAQVKQLIAAGPPAIDPNDGSI